MSGKPVEEMRNGERDPEEEECEFSEEERRKYRVGGPRDRNDFLSSAKVATEKVVYSPTTMEMAKNMTLMTMRRKRDKL
jgi:hypothetical protein